MARDYRYISVDGHLEIKPEQWRDWGEPKRRERAPCSTEIDGKTAFLVENSPPYIRTDHNPGSPKVLRMGFTLDDEPTRDFRRRMFFLVVSGSAQNKSTPSFKRASI